MSDPDGQADDNSADQSEHGSDGDYNASEQELVDRDAIDFDPDEGLYSGTAVDGGSEIPGPHEQGDDVGGSAPGSDAGAESSNGDADESD